MADLLGFYCARVALFPGSPREPGNEASACVCVYLSAVWLESTYHEFQMSVLKHFTIIDRPRWLEWKSYSAYTARL